MTSTSASQSRCWRTGSTAGGRPRRVPVIARPPVAAPRTRPPPGSGAAAGRRSGARRQPARVPGPAAAGRGARPTTAGRGGYCASSSRLFPTSARLNSACSGRRRPRRACGAGCARSGRGGRAIRSCSSCAARRASAPATAPGRWSASRSRPARRRGRPASAPRAARGCAAVPGRRSPSARDTTARRRAEVLPAPEAAALGHPAAGVQHLLVQPHTVGADEHEPGERADEHVFQRGVVADSTAVTRCRPVSGCDTAARSSRGRHGDERVVEVGEHDVVPAPTATAGSKVTGAAARGRRSPASRRAPRWPGATSR